MNLSRKRKINKSLPVIMQSEVSECGLVCMTMMYCYFGAVVDMVYMRERFSVSTNGLKLSALIKIAGNLGLESKALRFSISNIAKARLPCVLHWDSNHFVVLKSIKRGIYIVHDPIVGVRHLTSELFSQKFSGVVLELMPGIGYKPVIEKRSLKLFDLAQGLPGFFNYVSGMFLFTVLMQLCTLASPYYFQLVIDNVINKNDFKLLNSLVLFFSAVLLLETVITYLRNTLGISLSTKLNIHLSAKMFSHFLRLPMEYFYKRQVGDMVSRFNAMTVVREFLTKGLVQAIMDGMMALITLFVIFSYSFKLSVLVVSIVILYFSVRYFSHGYLQNANYEKISFDAKVDSHLVESITSMQALKIFQKENSRENSWKTVMSSAIEREAHVSKLGLYHDTFKSFVFGGMGILIIYVAALEILSQKFTLGQFFAYATYMSIFALSIQQLVEKLVTLKILGIHLNRLSDVLFSKTEKELRRNRVSNGLAEMDCTIEGKIEVKNLSYRYSEDQPYVFQNVSFIIYPGETVAITGSSGAGKTTILKCLMGLLDPSEGEILIDDIPIYLNSKYREQIAAVMQNDQLINGSVIENIACFNDSIDEEKVFDCMKKACILNDIENLPMGLRTIVSNSTSNLSGGQIQRLFLARALYRNPKILFLDEATSSLDVENELKVSGYIKLLSITRVIVAHRRETLATVDREIKL